MPVALAALAGLVIVLWIIALCLLIIDIAGYVSGAMSGLPFPLNKLGGILNSIAQGLTNLLGRVEAGLDHAIGAAWHQFARYLDNTWHQMEQQAGLIAHLAEVVGNQLYAHSGLSTIVHTLERIWHGIEARVKKLEKEWHGIEARVKALERAIGKGIGNDVRSEVRALERTVGHLSGEVIPAIENAETALQNDITNLGEWVRANFVGATTDAITAAVAVGLAGLGLGGLRCSNFGKLLGKFGCGLGTLLNDLLGIMISLVALEAVCEYLTVIEDAFGAIIGPMVHLLNEVPLGACEKPPKRWVTISVDAGPQPPAQTLGTFSG